MGPPTLRWGEGWGTLGFLLAPDTLRQYTVRAGGGAVRELSGGPTTTLTNVENQSRTMLSVPERAIISLLAICTTMVALLLAVLTGGPFTRAFFGVPVGFREHFTSYAAFRQALFVQVVVLSLAFWLLGIALGSRVSKTHFRWAMWAANPITVGVGFVAYKLIYQSLPLTHDVEYYNIRNGAILAITAPLVFAFCSLVGARLFNMVVRKT